MNLDTTINSIYRHHTPTIKIDFMHLCAAVYQLNVTHVTTTDDETMITHHTKTFKVGQDSIKNACLDCQLGVEDGTNVISAFTAWVRRP